MTCLTAGSNKTDFVERLMAMSLIVVMQKGGESEAACLTYMYIIEAAFQSAMICRRQGLEQRLLCEYFKVPFHGYFHVFFKKLMLRKFVTSTTKKSFSKQPLTFIGFMFLYFMCTYCYLSHKRSKNTKNPFFKYGIIDSAVGWRVLSCSKG